MTGTSNPPSLSPHPFHLLGITTPHAMNLAFGLSLQSASPALLFPEIPTAEHLLVRSQIFFLWASSEHRHQLVFFSFLWLCNKLCLSNGDLRWLEFPSILWVSWVLLGSSALPVVWHSAGGSFEAGMSQMLPCSLGPSSTWCLVQSLALAFLHSMVTGSPEGGSGSDARLKAWSSLLPHTVDESMVTDTVEKEGTRFHCEREASQCQGQRGGRVTTGHNFFLGGP